MLCGYRKPRKLSYEQREQERSRIEKINSSDNNREIYIFFADKINDRLYIRFVRIRDVKFMEVAIVDDEKVIREQIKKLTVKYEPDCNVIAYETGEELLAEGKKADIVFLDIQMEGMNGIDTARTLREKQEDMVVIFITGVKEYVFEAFDVSAFYYLLKPIEEKKFSEIFERAKKEVGKLLSLSQGVSCKYGTYRRI